MLISGEWRVYVLVASTILVRYACMMQKLPEDDLK